MAVCKYCELEMIEADGCVKLPVKTVDGDFDPVIDLSLACHRLALDARLLAAVGSLYGEEA